MTPPVPLYVGIDVGGTKTLAVVADATGQILGRAVNPSQADRSASVIVDVLVQTAREAVSDAEIDPAFIQSVGIASAGAVDAPRGVLISCPQMPIVKDAPIAAMFRDRWDIPIAIGNDGNLAALAEQRFGAGKGTKNLLFITVSTGIGGGIIINGAIYTGTSGFAGEIGHITVDTHGPYGRSRTPGAWESHCSGVALARITNERIGAGESSLLANLGGDLDAIAIFDALRAGDALAASVVADAIEHMSTGLTSVVNILDPEIIIIGGGLSNEWESYIAPSVARMRTLAFAEMGKHTRVTPPALGVEAGALGAVALAASSS